MIDNSSVVPSSDISLLIDSLDIVPLQETPGNYIAEAYKVFTLDDKIIAFDFVNTHKINLYDSKGNFLRNVVKTGESKNDAFQINDCWLDDNNNLRLLDFASKKIMIFDSAYNLKKIVKSRQLNIFSNVCSLPGSENYAGFASLTNIGSSKNGKFYELSFLDSNFAVTNTQLPVNKEFQGVFWLSFPTPFYNYKDTLRFGRFFDNYIYNISGNNFYKRFKLIYSNHPAPDNVLEAIVKPHLNEFKDPKQLSQAHDKYLKAFNSYFGTWLENENLVYFNTLGSEGRIYYGLINKADNYKVTNLTYRLSVEKKFKMDLPAFQYYDKRGYLIGSMNGKWLRQLLKPGCPFSDLIADDVSKLYIIKAKLTGHI